MDPQRERERKKRRRKKLDKKISSHKNTKINVKMLHSQQLRVVESVALLPPLSYKYAFFFSTVYWSFTCSASTPAEVAIF